MGVHARLATSEISLNFGLFSANVVCVKFQLISVNVLLFSVNCLLIVC